MKCIILAAGYATRLYPLTLNSPKSLLKIGDKPLVGHIIDGLSRIDNLKEVYVVTNQKFFEEFNNWKKSGSFKIKLEIVSDNTTTNENRLGAIGDLNFIIKDKNLDEDILVIAGDNLFDFDLNKFLEFAQARKGAPSLILYDIKNFNDAKRYGVVLVDDSKKVILFEEKPENPKSTLIGTGIYFLPKEAIKKIAEYTRKYGDKKDAIGFYIKWLSENLDVYGFVFGGDWFDIGDMEVLKKVQEKYKS